jgi:hypothetical protein
MEAARNLRVVNDYPLVVENLSRINAKIERGELPDCEFPMIVSITPEDAENILTNRLAPNRTLSGGRVKAWAMQLKKGQWSLNGEPLIFGRLEENGNVESRLMDGRHRLTACKQTGVSFRSFASFNIKPECFYTIDQGKARSTGDLLSVDKVKSAKDVAAAAKRLYLFNDFKLEIYQSNNGLAAIPSNNIIDHFRAHPMLVDSVQKSLSMKKKKLGLVTQMSVLHYHVAYNLKFKEMADYFVETTASGDNLKSNSPQFQLREFIRVTDSRAKETQKYTQEARQKALVIAWNYFLRGKTISSSLEAILNTALKEDQEIKIIKDPLQVRDMFSK